MSPRNGWNNLYHHPFSLSKGQKLLFYLTSLSLRGPVNPSTVNFPNINLTRRTTDVPVFQMSPKYSRNNLNYHPFRLSKLQKLFSYLTSLSRCGPLNLSTPNFHNINLTRIITNLPVVSNVTKKRL